jgi:hypothetical protein
LQHLNFSGGDGLVEFDNCHKGLSMFSLAPLEDSDNAGKIRERILHYEESAAQHGPADRAAFASLSSVVVASPQSRDRLLRWVNHCEYQLTILLGPECPLNAPLVSSRVYSIPRTYPVTPVRISSPCSGCCTKQSGVSFYNTARSLLSDPYRAPPAEPSSLLVDPIFLGPVCPC